MPADATNARAKTALVTGATSGIGRQTAIELARRGYGVTLLGRDETRLRLAEAIVRAEAKTANRVTTLQVDLSDFDQVREAANRLREEGQPLGLLVNNAAIMAPPRMMTGAAGHELQLTVNHLSHHILTARLMPLLQAEPGSRVVAVSSIRAQQGDRQGSPWSPLPYDGHQAYATSKLWNLTYALWLDNALHADPSEMRSVAAHPGWSRTGLHSGAPCIGGPTQQARVRVFATRCLGQDVERGILSIMAAATDDLPDRPCYLGPDGFRELRGRRTADATIGLAGDREFQAWVMARSIELTRTNLAI